MANDRHTASALSGATLGQLAFWRRRGLLVPEAAMPDVVAELADVDGQRLVAIIGIDLTHNASRSSILDATRRLIGRGSWRVENG